MFNTELHLEFHTVFIQLLARTFLLSFGRAGKFSADWHSLRDPKWLGLSRLC